MHRDDAGDRLTGEGDLALAGPPFRKLLADLVHKCQLFGGDGAAYFNAVVAQALESGPACRQLAEVNEEIRHYLTFYE
jgi:hypothetical protein